MVGRWMEKQVKVGGGKRTQWLCLPEVHVFENGTEKGEKGTLEQVWTHRCPGGGGESLVKKFEILYKNLPRS